MTRWLGCLVLCVGNSHWPGSIWFVSDNSRADEMEIRRRLLYNYTPSQEITKRRRYGFITYLKKYVFQPAKIQLCSTQNFNLFGFAIYLMAGSMDELKYNYALPHKMAPEQGHWLSHSTHTDYIASEDKCPKPIEGGWNWFSNFTSTLKGVPT